MIKIKSILNEIAQSPRRGSRRRIIDLDVVVRLLLTSHSESFEKYRHDSTALKRRLEHAGEPYYFINPKTIERRSKESTNFYTTMVSMLPSWKNYPKRTRSIIALSNDDPPGDYGGYIYYIFPKNGAKIAVSSTDDFWYGAPYARTRIDKSLESLGVNFPVLLSAMIKHVLKSNVTKSYHDYISNISESTYKDVMAELDTILTKEKVAEIEPLSRELATIFSSYPQFIRDMAENFNGSWEQYFDGLFDPEKNQVKLLTINDMKSEINKECWLDSPCVLIEYDTLTSIEHKVDRAKRTVPNQPINTDQT